MYTPIKSDTFKMDRFTNTLKTTPSGTMTTDQACNFVYIDISATELLEQKFQNKTMSETWQRRGDFLPESQPPAFQPQTLGIFCFEKETFCFRTIILLLGVKRLEGTTEKGLTRRMKTMPFCGLERLISERNHKLVKFLMKKMK